MYWKRLLKLELIKLLNDETIKTMSLNKSLFEFYRVSLLKKDFFKLKGYALEWLSVSGYTYLCKQFFSQLNIIKTRHRSRLIDVNHSTQLRDTTLSVPPNRKRLVKKNSEILLRKKTSFYVIILLCFYAVMRSFSCFIYMSFLLLF